MATTSGNFTSVNEWCDPNPCLNAGFCENAMCICSGGWGGSTCDEFSFFKFPEWTLLLGFLIISVSSYSMGKYFKALRLPLITGYLLMGIVAGPSVLNLIPDDEIRALGFIDAVSLDVIAFAAGTKLFLGDYKKRIKAVSTVTSGLVFFEYSFGTLVVFLCSLVMPAVMPFMAEFTLGQKFCVALLTSTLMVARSPATILAIVDELKAKGPFTSLAVGVTVVTDLVVIFFFALNRLIADSVFNHANAYTFLWSIGRILLSTLAGVLLGKTLPLILFSWNHKIRKDTAIRKKLVDLVTITLFLLVCLCLSSADQVEELMLDSLIIMMVSGFVLVNFTTCKSRMKYLLKKMSPLVYVGFFTLTGAALELKTLDQAVWMSLLLLVSRLLAIILGSYFGARVAGETANIAKYSWLTYVTQAGVSLGLAKRIHLLFPSWGGEFATVIVSVVVVNQLLGPVLCKYALRKVGEANTNRFAAKGMSLVITDAQEDDSDTQSEVQALIHIARESSWDVKCYLWWKLIDQLQQTSVAELMTALVGEELDYLSVDQTDERYATAVDDEGKIMTADLDIDIQLHGAENETPIELIQRSSSGENLEPHTSGSSTSVNILALESAVSDALNSAQVKQPTPVDAIVLVLSNDEYIMKICNFMATHYPQVKMIIRLLPSSKLRLADNDITEQDAIDNWLLPHAVNVVHPALSTPHLMAEMMLDPHYDENAEGFFSKHAELTLAKKIAAGIFGSVQQLKNGGVYGMQELHNAFSPKHQTNALNTEVDGAAVDETKQNSMNEENSDSE